MQMTHFCKRETCRSAWQQLYHLALGAASSGQVTCLAYLLDRIPCLAQEELFGAAAQGGQLACLKLLHARGCKWDPFVAKAAIEGGCLHCFGYVLDHTQAGLHGPLLEETLLSAMRSSNGVEVLKVMYNKGLLTPGQAWNMPNPPLIRLDHGISTLEFLVRHNGRPPVNILSTAHAAGVGVDALKYVHKLGAMWEQGTMRATVCVATMQYAHEHGCPWGDAKMSHFLGDVDRLRYAHRHGCPFDTGSPSSSIPLKNFGILQYICEEQMDHGWVERVLLKSVRAYKDLVEACLGPPGPIVDWQVALYLVKQIGRDRSGQLGELVDAIKARRVALAECFYMAGKYTDNPDIVRRDVDGPRIDGRNTTGRARGTDRRAIDGRDINGRDIDGRAIDGHGIDGPDTDERDTNGHSIDGHDTDGHIVDRRGRMQAAMWAAMARCPEEQRCHIAIKANLLLPSAAPVTGTN